MRLIAGENRGTNEGGKVDQETIISVRNIGAE